MKPEEILDAIGNVDDKYIKIAKENKRINNKLWAITGIVAACILCVLIVPNIQNFIGYKTSDEDAAFEVLSNNDLATAQEYIQIYYVDGNEIHHISEYLECDPQVIFTAWKEKNGIGPEVTLISCMSESNSETFYSEFNGEGVAAHKVGDYFILKIVISKNIENYYNKIDSELLLKSLEETMMNYTDDNEFHISFE